MNEGVSSAVSVRQGRGGKLETTVVIDRIEVRQSGEMAEASAVIIAGDREHPVWFRWPGTLAGNPADAFLIVAIPAAMRLGGKLVVRGRVSARLLANAALIQQIYHCWDPELSVVDIEADDIGAPDACAEAGEVASVFTGGVDSFYTVLKRSRELDYLLFIHGYDVRLEDQALRQRVSASLQQAAARLGKPLLEAQSNVRREFSDHYMPWNIAFGGALAAVAVLLSARLGKFYIAAGQSYLDLLPDGAHPVLNPLFGTEHIKIETDGCEVNRFEKIEAIAPNPVAMEFLRVCWQNRGGAYNCCRCEKCLRTMAALQIVGVLDRCRTFDQPLDYELLAQAKPSHDVLAFMTRENIDGGERLGADPKLLAAMRRQLACSERQRIISDLRARIRLRTRLRNVLRCLGWRASTGGS
jgi:hypothetical protein